MKEFQDKESRKKKEKGQNESEVKDSVVVKWRHHAIVILRRQNACACNTFTYSVFSLNQPVLRVPFFIIIILFSYLKTMEYKFYIHSESNAILNASYRDRDPLTGKIYRECYPQS